MYEYRKSVIKLVVFVGIFLIIVGTIIISLGILNSTKSSGGMVIFVGPIPIAVSWGSWGPLLLLISLLILIMMFIVMYLMLKYQVSA
ncbi:MAG: hypothetical protein DRJ41_04790 [Thermoprotei archaeon]|nr:MAG: hypothetical protein DRJ41_04790 [Thermoprotei archaeon]